MPWRDLPERFGPLKSVYDEVGSIVDGSVVRALHAVVDTKGRFIADAGYDSMKRFRAIAWLWLLPN